MPDMYFSIWTKMIATAFGATFLLSGCGSVYLHNEVKNKLATEAKEQYDPAAIQTTVKTARKNFDTMRDRAKNAATSRANALRDEILLNVVYMDRPFNLFFYDTIGPLRLKKRGLLNSAGLMKTLAALEEFSGTQNDVRKKSVAARQGGVPSGRCYAIQVATGKPTEFETQEFERAKIKPQENAIAEIEGSLKELKLPDDKEEIDKLEEDKKRRKALIATSRKKFNSTYAQLAESCRKAEAPLAALHVRTVQNTAQAKAGISDDLCEPDGTLTAKGRTQSKGLNLQAICALTKVKSTTDCAPDAVGGNDFLTNSCQLLVAKARARQKFVELLPQMQILADARRALAKAERDLKAAADDEKKKKKAIAQIKKAIETFNNNLDIINRIGGYLGIKAVAQERVDAIDMLVVALLTGEIDKDKATTANIDKATNVLTLVNSLKSIADSIRKRETDFNLSNLLLRRRVEAARLAFATAEVTRQEQEIELLTQKVMTYAPEFELYRSINRNLCFASAMERKITAKCKTSDNPETLFEISSAGGPLSNTKTAYLLQGKDPKLRRSLVHAVTDTALLRAGPNLERKNIQVGLSLLAAEKKLAQSKANVEMWDALVQIPLTQLQAYHAGGIKTAELADLIVKIAGLAGIAIRLD